MPKKYSGSLSIILFFALCSVILSSCTFGRIFNRRVVTYVTIQDSVDVHVSPGYSEHHKVTQLNHRLYEDRTKTTVHNSVKDTLTTKTESYALTQRKKGYLSSTTTIKKTRFNPWKIADLTVPGIFGVVIATQNITSDSPLQYGIYYYALYGIWFNIVPGPYLTFKSTIHLPPLVPIKYRENDENRVYVKDVDVDRDITTTFVSKTDVKEEFNHDLRTWGYVDTNGLFSRLYSGAYLAKCTIHNQKHYTLGKFECIVTESTWQILAPDGNKELLQLNLNDTASFGYDNSATVIDAGSFTCLLNRFLKNSDVIKILKEKPVTTAIADTVLKAIPVSIGPPDSVNSLEDALKAVVTLKTKNNTFSGCIISSNGYVVTNAHLLSDDKIDSIDVHLSGGDSTTAKFIRTNALYDMALFKISRPGHYISFLPDTSHNINLGEEVYAIGTAGELNLKQTTTKGIISGKRKVKDKYVIQTDASINRGSSGGAIVNKNGRLLGIINTRFVGIDIQGIGFAVPAYYIPDALKLTVGGAVDYSKMGGKQIYDTSKAVNSHHDTLMGHEIVIKINANDTIHSLGEALRAVVTVKVKDGHGSGCIISPDGYVITNYHVVKEDSSNEYTLVTDKGVELHANKIRVNKDYDLALLKIIKPEKCTYLLLADTAYKKKIGDVVYAIGTPLSLTFGQSLTKGIISGNRNKEGKDFIQTDVSVNAGNSGGALINKRGTLLGIVNSKIVGEGVEGLGFAIPTYYIEKALDIKFVK